MTTEGEKKLLAFISEQLILQHTRGAGELVDFMLYTPLHDVTFEQPLHVCVCQFPRYIVRSTQPTEAE